MVRTIQTKPYESVKIEVSVEDECIIPKGIDPTKVRWNQIRDSMYEKLSGFVRDKIEEEEDRWS